VAGCPQELEQFIADGPSFDMSARLESEATAAINQLGPAEPGGESSPRLLQSFITKLHLDCQLHVYKTRSSQKTGSLSHNTYACLQLSHSII
jgi:hypothetical protein